MKTSVKDFQGQWYWEGQGHKEKGDGQTLKVKGHSENHYYFPFYR